jgi:hypothetical protein
MVRRKLSASSRHSGRQLVLVGKGDGVDEEVDLAPQIFDLGEDGVERLGLGDVAMADDMGAELGGERLDALPEGLALIGEARSPRPVGGAGRLGDAPGDRSIVGDSPRMRPRLPAIDKIGSSVNIRAEETLKLNSVRDIC